MQLTKEAKKNKYNGQINKSQNLVTIQIAAL